MDDLKISPLHLACIRGDTATIKTLLCDPAVDPNNTKVVLSDIQSLTRGFNAEERLCIGMEGCTPFVIACRLGHTEDVKLLRKHRRVDVNWSDGGFHALHAACENGHVDVVRFLLAHTRFDVNRENIDGFTPLYLACKRGHTDVVRLLLLRCHELDINHKTEKGHTSFYIACSNGHLEVVELLLSRQDLDPNEPDERGNSPFLVACERNRLDIVRHLLGDPQIDITAVNKEGASPLIVACQEHNKDVVLELLNDPRTDINHRHLMNQITALNYACGNPDTDIVKLLLARKDIDLVHAKTACWGALYSACDRNDDEVVRLFLGFEDLDINHDFGTGETLLHVACSSHSLKVVKLLLADPRVDVNKRMSSGETPLLMVCKNHETQQKVIKLLLDDPRVDINLADNNGKSPLMVCVDQSLNECVEALAGNARIDINYARPNDKLTALHMACSVWRPEPVQILLKNTSLDPNILDSKGFTPFHRACLFDCGNAVEMLMKDKRVDINKSGVHDRTPFTLVCSVKGRSRILKLMAQDPRTDMAKAGGKLGETPIWAASSSGNLEAVKWILAMGKGVDPRALCTSTMENAVEAAIGKGFREIASLLLAYEANPVKVRRDLLVDLKVAPRYAAELYASSVLVCDDFYKVPEADCSPSARLYHIICRLPLELKALLANRIYHVNADYIPSKDLETALKKFVLEEVEKNNE